MNFFEYFVIAVAPSVTLGLVIFFAKNWFLERLKNSIKHEYDLSLEKFKGELKFEKDKELEDLKAILKKQTDVNLEDYRFQIEIRKKWLDDFKNLSSKYLDIVKENVDLFNQYVLKDELALSDANVQFDNYKETLYKLNQISADLSTTSFKIDLLISDGEQSCEEIKKYKIFIEDWLRTELVDNFVEKQAVDYESEKILRLKSETDKFKASVIKLLEIKSTKL